MRDRLSRRAFVGMTPPRRLAVARPAAVSSSNGLRAVARAMELALGGTDPLDAAVEGVKIQELDPEDDSYTDNDVGAAGSTGRGEANIMACGGFLTVEHMRRGMAPADACLATLKRVQAVTPPRLLHPDGRPRFNLSFYAVNKRGDFGSASFYPARFAAHDGKEAALRDTAHLYQRAG